MADIKEITIEGTTYNVKDETARNGLSGKSDKVASATNGDFAGLDSSGNLTDSGYAPSDFAAAATAVPAGGTTGQVLAKKSNNNNDLEWVNQGGGGTATDVQVNGTSITSNDVANIITEGAYNASSNKIATMSDLPTVPDISTNITTDASSDTKTTSPKAVKTFVEGKGYGTYSKPSGGIPASDLVQAVQTSLGKADTALQSYTESDPIFQASPAAGITAGDISDWDGKAEPIPVVNVSTVPASMDADKLYDYGTLSADIIFPSLNTPSDATNAHVFWWTFKVPATAPNVGWPASGITEWSGGSPPNIDASTTYEIMVSNGFASYIKST